MLQHIPLIYFGLPIPSAVPRDMECNMAKSTRNTGKPWSTDHVGELKKLAAENTPTRVIGLKLGRTEDAVRSKAHEEGISLKPVNQAPYNRRDKS